MANLSLVFDLLARDKASPEFNKVGNAAERAGKQTHAFGKVTSGAMKSAGAAVAGIAVGSLFGGFIKDAAESARIGRITGQVIKTTGGAAHVTAKQVETLATSISNKTAVDDEAIQSASNLLLTFTKVRNETGKGNDVFNQATQAAVDMSVAMGTDANGAALQLGKALNDPIKGITALSRAGVSFTAQQKDQIKAMVEAGDTLGAQKLILKEMQTQFGGAAEAAADPLARLSVIAGNLGEEIGGQLLPAVNGFADFASDTLIPAVAGTAEAIGDVVGFVKELPGPVKVALGAFAAWSVLGGKVTDSLGRLKTSGAAKVFDDLRLKMMYAKEEGEGLRTKIGAVGSAAGNAASGAIGSLARAVGPELIAAIAVGGLALLAEDFKKITNAGAGAKDMIDEVNDSLDETGNAGRIDATSASIGRLRDSMADAQAVIDAKGGEQGFLANLIGPTAVWAGQAAAMKDAEASVDLLGDAIEEIERKQRATDETATALADTYRLTEEQVLALADKYKIDLSDGITESSRLFGNFYSRDLGRKPTEATLDLTAATEDAKKAIDAAARAVDAYKLSLDILSGKTVSTIEVEAALEGALDAAKGAVKGLDGSVKTSNGSLNLHSEAGRAASDVLLDVRNSGNQLIATMIDQGATTDQVTAKDRKLRESFIKSAMQMGFSKGEARKLADQILGIPDERETKIKADTKAAKKAVGDLQEGIDNLHGRTVTIGVGINAPSAISGVNGRVGGFFEANGGVVDYFANGGLRENHTAQIAPAGSWRMWAEPETGGEAYIPLSPNKRARSLSIWEETGRRLNAFADGGLVAPVSIRAELDARTYDTHMNTLAARVAKLYEPAQGLVGALQWARSQVGKPYIWGGVGPAGFDCSGFMSAITNVIRGRSPYSRIGSTASFPWSGFASGMGSFTIGSTPNAGGGIGHMAGTLLGVNVESAGGVGVRIGSAARGATSGLFSTRAHLAMANGGVIGEPVVGVGASGRSYSFGERGPETVTPGVPGGLVGLEITGRFVLEEDGFVRLVDGRIVDALDSATSRSRYSG